MMEGSRVGIAGLLLLAVVVLLAGAQGANAQVSQGLAVEDTLAWKMLDIEKAHRAIPQNAPDILRAALEGEIRALGPNPQQPKTAAEAVAVSRMMATALARRNFLQPDRKERLQDTLGQTFAPVSLNKQTLKNLLRFGGNVQRARYIKRSRPIYYVDCDMAALLLISAAQMLGWDVRLVEVPDHSFIRWHLPDGNFVNWDWTTWTSKSDARYAREHKLGEGLVRRGIYLRSYSPAEAYGYYLGLIASNVDDPAAKMLLFEDAIDAGPNVRTTANNYAWAIATHPGYAAEKTKAALSLALRAWSTNPQDGRIADTVACVFAALKETATAQAIEDYAIRSAENSRQKAGFRSNRERITKGRLCQ